MKRRVLPRVPGSWGATLTQIGRFRWEVDIHKGGLRYGPMDGHVPFVKWGEQRAIEFAQRTITKLTLRDIRERDARRIEL